jgi:Skp family chaperone for outer membrane proteins
MGKNMKFFKTLFVVFTASFFTFNLQSADLNIATLDPQAALFSTNVAKKELEELENSDEWKEVVEELQAKATEAREIQERTQKDGPTMSDEEKQEAAQKFQSLQQDINFLREKTNQFRNQTLQLLSQEQAEKFQVIVTELIRAKGITLLINSGAQQQILLHADQSYDITQEVIDAMNEKED